MTLTSLRNLFAATALAAACVVAPGRGAVGADDPEPAGTDTAKKKSEDGAANEPAERLSAHEFFTMAPFVVPVINKGEHQKQFVLVIAIGLEDEDDRDELRRLSPKMRNAIYEMLFRLVSFRTIAPRIPRTEILEARLMRTAKDVAGDAMVKSLVIHTANVVDVH